MLHLNGSQLHHRSDSLGNHVELLSASWGDQWQVFITALEGETKHPLLSAPSQSLSSKTSDPCRAFPYRVLQEELRSQEHLPSFSVFFEDWEPQQLRSDSHTGVQFHNWRACAAAHGLILTLASWHTKTPLIPNCICLYLILKHDMMCSSNSQLGRCRTVPTQHPEDCGQWFVGLHRSQGPQR